MAVYKCKMCGGDLSAAGGEKVVECEYCGTTASTESLLKRVFMFLEDGNWSKADEYCEKVLDIVPECAKAYLGKLMAELHISRQEQLADAEKPFSDNSNYQKAVRFGDEKLVATLRGYIEQINDRNENIKLERKIKIDNIARAILNHGKSVSFENTRKTIKREISDKIVIIEREIDELQKSVENIGATLEEKHAELNALLNENISVSNIPMTYKEAKQELSADKALKEDVFNAYPEIRFALGEIILFGTYPQNADGKDKTPILWRVLAKKNSKILVISDKALDCRLYNTSHTDVTWETCSLRKWMNRTFLNNAFSAEEQAQIQSTTVSADKNPKYSTNPGNAKTDKVFLLSITEVNKYFLSDEDRKCVPTKYAVKRGASTSNSHTKGGAATGWWWLRSPGDNRYFAAHVDYDGSVDDDGHLVSHDDVCVRPAMWISVE